MSDHMEDHNFARLRLVSGIVSRHVVNRSHGQIAEAERAANAEIIAHYGERMRIYIKPVGAGSYSWDFVDEKLRNESHTMPEKK